MNNLDEWIEFLKTGEISEAAQAPGLADARKCLDIDKLTVAEKNDYVRHMENLRYQRSVIKTGYDDGLLRQELFCCRFCFPLKQNITLRLILVILYIPPEVFKTKTFCRDIKSMQMNHKGVDFGGVKSCVLFFIFFRQ